MRADRLLSAVRAVRADRAERAELVRQRFHFATRPAGTRTGTARHAWPRSRTRCGRNGPSGRRWKVPTDVERMPHPYGIGAQGRPVVPGGGWTGSGAGARTYRVNQILSLSMMDGQFACPATFDLARYWRTHLSEFRSGLRTGEATIRLSPAGRRRLADLFNALVVAAVEASASAPDTSGRVTATIPIESLPHAESELSRLGAEVEVLEPPPLRDRMAATARRLSVMYAP